MVIVFLGKRNRATPLGIKAMADFIIEGVDENDESRTMLHECDNSGEARRTKLAAAYVALVGYDPFTDDPSISVDEVESALAELTALHAGVAAP